METINSPQAAYRKSSTVIVLALLATVAYITSTQTVARAARPCCQGDQWLKLSPEAREFYVVGFMEGSVGGYDRACWNATKGLEGTLQQKQIGQCMHSQPTFAKDSATYADAITKFYAAYPSDRSTSFHEVLEKLATGQTIEEIHERRAK
jgi:hypothetical protein